MITRIISSFAVLAGLVCTRGCGYAQDYDLVINDGRVMDLETNYDGVANVGIKDGKVAVITTNAIMMAGSW